MPKQLKTPIALKQLIQSNTERIAKEAYNMGYVNGLETGEIIGYVRGVNDLKPALSDGLRHGSPECGKAMQGLKNIGAYSDEESDEDNIFHYEYPLPEDEVS